MTILFQDDFSGTQLVNGKLTGWPDGFIHSPESISFVQDPLNPDNRVLQVRKGGVGSNRETEVAQYRNEREFWTRTKLFFPNDFHLTSLTNKWFVPCDTFFEYVDNKNTLALGVVLWDDSLHLVASGGEVVNGTYNQLYQHVTDTYIPRGQWVTLISHVIRDNDNGIIECFVDDKKVSEFAGKTRLRQDNFNWIPIKHYCETDESINSVLYDDVMFATTAEDVFSVGPQIIIEPSPPGPFTIEVKPCLVTAAGAPLALLIGLRAVRMYLPGWFVRGYYDFSKIVLAGW